MTGPYLIWELFTYLAGEGFGRDPSVPAPSGNPDLPPIWVQPRHGPPAPGQTADDAVEEGPTATVSLVQQGGLPTVPFQGFIRQVTVDVWLRVTKAPLAFDLDEQLKGLINDKRGWQMGVLFIDESLMVRELQPVGSDDVSFDFTTEYLFTTWA